MQLAHAGHEELRFDRAAVGERDAHSLRASSKFAAVTLGIEAGSAAAVPDCTAHSTEYASSSDCQAKRRLQSVFWANEKL